MGAFVPTLVFILIGVVLVVPLFPSDWAILKPLEALGTESPLIAVAFFTILLTGLLYNLNSSLIRLLEGYPWQGLWIIGRMRTKHYQAQFDAALAQRAGMRTLIRAMEQQGTDADLIEKVQKKRTRAALLVNTDFPHKRPLVLPTRLGNVIRSFETYPNRQYGIDGVTMWPRLIAKVAPDYGAAVADAKTSFDFVLNSLFLSGIMALTILIVGLLNPLEVVSSGDAAALWIGSIVIFTLLAFLLYLALIDRAKAWGEMFGGAFDLYRKELLTQLSYERSFTTVAEERAFWEFASRQVVYGDPPASVGQPLQYTIAPTFARSSTPGANLELGRGFEKLGSDGSVKIKVRVKNTNSKCNAVDVIVTDTLVEGFHYVWGSARVRKRESGTTRYETVRVTGTDPYDFHIKDIGSGKQVTLTYGAVRISGE